MRRLVVALVAAASLAGAASAAADELSGAQLRALAQEALHDRNAQARLARVNRIDGRPVDLANALRGARGKALAARLRLLAQPAGGAAPSHARRDARVVLGESRFHDESLPHPLHGALAWIARKLHWIGRPYNWLGSRIGLGDPGLLTFAAVLVALIASLLAFLTASRRAGAEVYRFPEVDGIDPEATPDELERLAVERERSGDYEAAVRLRFRAGLLSLDRARAIRYRPSLTSAELSHRLRSEDFDGIAHDFDEIVYGGRAALPDDAVAAREGWRRVLARGRRSEAR